jgi:hypothetical protein
MVGGDRIVQGDDISAEGDVNIVSIGAGAHVGQAAAGKNITQSSLAAMQETNDLAEKLLGVNRALQNARPQLDAAKIALAEFQLQLLQNELTKTEGAVSGSTITSAADGLEQGIPQLKDALGALFRTTAAQKILAQAGAGDWLKKRFG